MSARNATTKQLTRAFYPDNNDVLPGGLHTTAIPAAIAFEGDKRLAAGSLFDVATAVRKRVSKATHENIHVFDHATSKLSISISVAAPRRTSAPGMPTHPPPLASAPEEPVSDAPRGPGRPKLGVVAREVTLLPRHWDWLNAQPGGASVALRKLVEEARKTRGQSDTSRARQEAAYRFLSAIAGDWRNYEGSKLAHCSPATPSASGTLQKPGLWMCVTTHAISPPPPSPPARPERINP